MTAPDPHASPMTAPARSSWLPAITLLLVAGLAVLSAATLMKVQAQQRELASAQDSLQKIYAEVTRARIEQSVDGVGPRALMTKLRHYAALAADTRTTDPDYKNALAEMQAVMRAFDSVGEDAWTPIVKRLDEVDAKQDFDEIKWLLEAALRVDEKAAKQIVRDVLLGLKLPLPRLRWWAATLLTERDKPLAQRLLRQILLTESNRGINKDRIHRYPGMVIPDVAAVATTGFNNFVTKYIRTDDPKTEETLLMLLGRVEHDSITIQECVKELGQRQCKAAVEPIKKLFKSPPLQQQNPMFLIICVRGVHAILGPDAKDWLEEVIATAPTKEVADVARALLGK